MLRDLMRRAMRAGETELEQRRRLSIPFRPSRQRRGRLEDVKGSHGFRARWVPNDTIPRFHACWWTRLRVRAGVTPLTLGAAR